MKVSLQLQRRRAPRPGPSISLFPFLAVLICTMGALVPLLLAISRTARLQAEATAKAKAAERSAQFAAETKTRQEDAQWRIEQLKQSRQRTERRLADARLELGHFEEHARRLRGQLAQCERAMTDLDQMARTDGQQVAQGQAELCQLRGQVETAKRQLDEARRAADGRARSFAVVPYEGPNQTQRRPIYVECRADGVVLQPEGVRLTEVDFDGPLGPGNPLAAALRAAREHLKDDPRVGEPYPLLLVRPDGIGAYYAARAAMKSWGGDFGYELIGDDWKLAYQPPDPKLAQLFRQAIGEGRVSEAELAAAAPRAYGRPRSSRPRPSDNGDQLATDGQAMEQSGDGRGSGTGATVGAGGGVPGASNGSSIGGPQGGYAGGSGSSTGGSGELVGPAFSGSGLAAGGGSGSPTAAGFGGSAAGSSSGGAIGTGTSIGGGSGSAGTFAGAGGSGVGGGSDAGGNFAGGGASGTSSGTGLASSSASPGGGSSVGDPTAAITGGTPSGGTSGGRTSDRGNASRGSGHGATAATPSGQYGSWAGGDAASASSGEKASERPDGYVIGQPAREQPSNAVRNGSASEGSVRGQALRPGEWEPTPEPPPKMPDPKDAPSAKKDKRDKRPLDHGSEDWALRNVGRNSVGITRPIRIECYVDRLLVISERDATNNRTVPLGPRTAAAVDPLVSSVWEQMDSWGMAGRGMYWRPVLQVSVAPGAERRFAELSRLLEGSGLTIERR